MKDIVILDDVIPPRYQDYIEEFLLDNRHMDWHLVKNLTAQTGSKELGNVGFSVQCITDGEDHGALAFVLRGLCYSASAKFGHDFKNIMNARAFLQTPNGTPRVLPAFHVDHPKPHTVLLYYVNDSDGPTMIAKQRYPFSHPNITGLKNAEILMEIEPKKGRAVLFNGAYFHDSSVPSTNLRCVVNFNLT
jgi:hypothetical protein